MKKIIFFILFLALGSCSKNSIDLPVEKINLKNGMTVLLVKREGAPVFSAHVRLRVGSIEEEKGSSGLAHFLEHMAFKGSSKIGTLSYQKEKEILQKIYNVGAELAQAKASENQDKTKSLSEKLKSLQEEHQKLIKANEFARIMQINGGSNLNATTSHDYTSYFVSLPSNKLELWFAMEGERLKDPVFREFYKERDVVAEERRMRYDNDPDGHLYETLMITAFDKSPYGIPAIGFADEIQKYTYSDIKKFHERYYIPSRMVVSIVGNFDSKKAKSYISKYFKDLEKKPDPQEEFAKDDLSSYPKEKKIIKPHQPRFYLAFPRPANPHPDDEIFDVMESLLCDGRTSRLYSRLVLEKRMASQVGCYASLPGGRLDGLFTFYAVPLKPYTNDQVKKEIYNIFEEIKEKAVTDQELKKVRNQVESNFLWALKSNMGLASMLNFFESLTGSWKYLYEFQEKIEKLTTEDIQRVVKHYFKSDREVYVRLERGET